MRIADYVVTGVGAVVSGVGWRNLPKKWGYFALGLGLAHVTLGLADLVFGAKLKV
ncbi:MAG: hypothetical protein ACM3WV_00815 [Bacillota bacterium]